ncbi:unnamed protein product [Acanthoscelides obtectus]|uniref:Uncharacterized protein n=1 Tax=Acanthoscelides obtectus TaxID=200917 RepID=A0A9P0Q232_ACAOB|nr:unnamed protein product [Acanthoscelides obtectus]CAK1656586.1 hypothetical protein AOBTE_LOCUS19817 [Acanthoscelides obtectus]
MMQPAGIREPLIEACQILAEQEDLKVTVKEASKGALIAGFGAFCGAILGGPPGLAIGGTIGSIIGATSLSNFKPVVQILKDELDYEQKMRLSQCLEGVMEGVNKEDVAMLVTLIITSPSLKEAVLKELGNFLLKELSVTMIR